MLRQLKNLRAKQESGDKDQSEITASIQVRQLNPIERQSCEENKMMLKTQNPISQTQGFLEVNRTTELRGRFALWLQKAGQLS